MERMHRPDVKVNFDPFQKKSCVCRVGKRSENTTPSGVDLRLVQNLGGPLIEQSRNRKKDPGTPRDYSPFLNRKLQIVKSGTGVRSYRFDGGLLSKPMIR